jgi:hypothetical protein
LRDSRRQGVDFAIRGIGPAHLFGKKILIDRTAPDQIAINGGDQIGVLRRCNAAVVWQGADIPKRGNVLRRARQIPHLEIIDQVLERALIDRRQGAGQPLDCRHLLKTCLQRLERREIELLGAPLQDLDRLEHMAFQPMNQIVMQGRHLPGDAKGPVAQMPARTAGNLAEFGCRQLPVGMAVELSFLGKGHMIDIEIEPHADGIGCHQIVDISVLIELDLGIAGARAERPQHNGRTAALAPNQFGNRVDLICRERHDGRTPRQPGDLFRSGIMQFRQPWPLDDGDAGQQLLKNAANRQRAQKQCFLASAQGQDPVGKHMPAFKVAGDLYLVYGNKCRISLLRHRFDGAHRVARTRRRDLLLAGDKRHMLNADLVDHAAIDFPRQKPQRQPDHARRVRCHPLDGVMRLAGVGRPQHRRDAAARKDQGFGGWLGKAGMLSVFRSGRALPITSEKAKQGLIAKNPKTRNLTIGTVAERIGDESMTRPDSGFVHPHICPAGTSLAPYAESPSRPFGPAARAALTFQIRATPQGGRSIARFKSLSIFPNTSLIT